MDGEVPQGRDLERGRHCVNWSQWASEGLAEAWGSL